MDWFFHDPGQGRVGPLSPDELRTRYRDRRIQRDTLVWRDGMREWQPLDRMAEELELSSVTPDARLPPPLPPIATLAHAGPAPVGGAYPHAARPMPRPRMSGWLIAVVVGLVLAVPLIGITAAIAIPAYHAYLDRSKVAARVDALAPAIEAAVQQARANAGRCPASAREAGLGDVPTLAFGEVDGRCAFRITVQGVNPRIDGRSVVFVAPASPADAWDCTGGDLPAQYRRPACRAEDRTP
ncbi:GYF domain-containing protein [Cognatilysobacter segetis]|uniref:GYF domain-containing protein n=1 Tax=Cognatilysobacter segetis TaxID=2492394 RepID=UPI00138FE971|nr:GYF domain-containing protein [Lysobacter segetis]